MLSLAFLARRKYAHQAGFLRARLFSCDPGLGLFWLRLSRLFLNPETYWTQGAA